MIEDGRAEELLRSFYRRQVDIEARRRAEKPAALPPSIAIAGASFCRPRVRRWPRELLVAAACLAAMAVAALAGPVDRLGPNGALIAAREIGRVADEKELFVPFRALWPAPGGEGEVP